MRSRAVSAAGDTAAWKYVIDHARRHRHRAHDDLTAVLAGIGSLIATAVYDIPDGAVYQGPDGDARHYAAEEWAEALHYVGRLALDLSPEELTAQLFPEAVQ